MPMDGRYPESAGATFRVMFMDGRYPESAGATLRVMFMDGRYPESAGATLRVMFMDGRYPESAGATLRVMFRMNGQTFAPAKSALPPSMAVVSRVHGLGLGVCTGAASIRPTRINFDVNC